MCHIGFQLPEEYVDIGLVTKLAYARHGPIERPNFHTYASADEEALDALSAFLQVSMPQLALGLLQTSFLKARSDAVLPLDFFDLVLQRFKFVNRLFGKV